MDRLYDIVTVGGGLSGLSTALAVSRAGYRSALVAPKDARPDGRTTALMMPSISLLEELGVWSRVAASAAPLQTMRIIDGTNRLIRSPTVTFQANEVGLEAFGFNIPNAVLLNALEDVVAETSRIDHITRTADRVTLGSQTASLNLSDGSTIETRLIAAADGRNSLIRHAAAIPVRNWKYPQTAIVLNFSHEIGHANTSNEFHTEHGPFTQVPLPGRMSSLVWAMSPSEAQSFASFPTEQLALKVETRMQSILGKVTIASPVQQFPFSGMIAQSFARDRVLLIGEAGHVFPPIGAQGLNLGLRDVVDLVNSLKTHGNLDSVDGLCSRYNRLRRLDVSSRTLGVDLLNRSLLSDFLPMQAMRSAGLSLLHHMAPLRQAVMREGLAPGNALRPMRPEV